jgi:nitrile hydratase
VRYQRGQIVRVAARRHEGHHRTPAYLKGKTGTVTRVHSSFVNPESRANGRDGLPKQPLYFVSFQQSGIWPEYRGDPADRLYVDVFEHWLEEAE